VCIGGDDRYEYVYLGKRGIDSTPATTTTVWNGMAWHGIASHNKAWNIHSTAFLGIFSQPVSAISRNVTTFFRSQINISTKFLHHK
jgi:hypothetical protein